jgi:hypothetical protein
MRIAKSGEGTAVAFRYKGMALGKAFDMHLIKSGAIPGHLRLCRTAPGESGVDYATFLHKACAVP